MTKLLKTNKASTTLVFTLFISLLGCSNQPCKIEDRTDKVMTGNEKVSSDTKDLTKKIFIYKPDGSLQCGEGKKIEASEMKKELGAIEVFSSENKHDGLMRVQLCGHPTGYCNVYQILTKDLDAAMKLGFKTWLRD